MMHRVGVVGILMLAAAPAWAEMGPIPGEERFQGLIPSDKQAVGAEFGFGGIEEDFFLQLNVKTELNLGPVGLGLQIPLNLRVWDKDPENNDDYYGYIRREDWDEPSEYAKVIRYVRLGHKRDAFFLRVGELASDIGHGTIMNRYLNNVDINTFRVGVAFDVNTDYGGIETVLSDIGVLYDTNSPDSRILGVRGYWKPFSLLDPGSLLNIFSVGASVVSGINAPATFERDADPTAPDEGEPGVPRIDSDGNLVVASTTAATVYGFDLEVELLHSALLDVIPYTDLNFIQQAGWGWHAGILATAKMPIGIDLTIPVRLEYRRFKQNYVPQYFDTFYEIERYSYDIGDEPVTKARTVRHLPSGKGYNGIYGDLAFDFAGIFQIGAVYEDTDLIDPSLQAFMAVPALEVLQFKAFYARTGITGTDDIFKLDERSLAVAQARYELMSYVYLVGRITQRWALDTDTASSNYGTYQPEREWKFGLETSFEF